ncbi:hypothetical protein D3C71_18630 [compost metagenome]
MSNEPLPVAAAAAPEDLGDFYRYIEVTYAAPADDYGESSGPGRTVVELRSYPVIRHTPQGAWIGGTPDGKRFVRLTANKRFACPTIAEAAESYKARKRSQLRILQARVARTQLVLAEIERMHPAMQLPG